MQPRPSSEPEGTIPPAASKLTFVENAGQTDTDVRYMARGTNHGFYFTPDKAVLDFRRGDRGVALELRFRGANPSPAIVAERRGPGRVNHIIASERHTGLKTYEQLRYRNLWPGIDMVFRGQGGQLKYEFLVRPGANPRDIRLAYAGADSLKLAGNGSLAIATPLGALNDARPKSFQGGRRVSSSYAISGSTYGFAIGSYDRSRPLVVDPGLLYGTYLGGAANDGARLLDVDSAGNVYVADITNSTSFPTTPGAYDSALGGGFDAYITKLDSAGALVYSTYLGGSADEGVNSVVVGPGGNVYVAGVTLSSDFPTTPGAFDTSHDPGDYFVTRLNAAGTGLVYSTNFPAEVADLAPAMDGGLYIGATVTGPRAFVPPSALDSTFEGFYEGLLAKLNVSGSALDWATYVGGEDEDRIEQVIADTSGNVYAAGWTQSVSEFPLTLGAHDTTNEGKNVFVSKVTPDGTAFSYSTLLGTNSFTAYGLDVDSSGHAYVTGGGEVPPTPGSYGGANGTFTTKLNTTGTSVIYTARAYGTDLAVDASGAVYLVTNADADSSLITPGAFDNAREGDDAVVFKLNPSATGLAYGTYFGGSGDDIGTAVEVAGGNAFVVGGYTTSTDLPTTPGSHDSSFNGDYDGFVAKLQSYDGYPRPKGATPLRLSLVNSYRSCGTVPNRTHGPPLAHPSCSPPQPESNHAVPGTGDSNGKPARMEGYLLLKALPGNPATPADESDVALEFFVKDVFKPDLTDYTDQLRVVFLVRITDRNTPESVMTTVQDFGVPSYADCVPTEDELEGSTCTLNTTVEAITGPGGVPEGKRSIWAIDNVRIFDAGADGDAHTIGDNTHFARPGVFVP